MPLFRWLAPLILVVAAIPAMALPVCNGALTRADEATARSQCEKPWLLVVHMAADNDLDEYALLDLYELQSIGSTPQFDIVVQLDLPGPTGVKRILIQKAERYNPRITSEFFEGKTLDSGFAFRLLGTLPEPSRQSEESKLRDFLVESQNQFPSRHSMVVVWGHGKGWTSLTRPHARSRDGGMGFSETSGRFLGVPALKRALIDSAAEAREGRPWDLFLSDACLMQMAEVITELSPAAEILLGSSQNQDYLGVPYRSLLQNMRAAPSPSELASSLPDLMKAFLEKSAISRGSTPDELDMGMSAIHAEEWTRYFLPAFGSFVEDLATHLSTNPELRARLQSIGREVERFENDGVELGTYLRRIDFTLSDLGYPASHSLRSELRKTVISLDRAVLSYAMSSPSRSVGKRSVSLWIPLFKNEFDRRRADFSRSTLHQATDLPELLRLLLAP